VLVGGAHVIQLSEAETAFPVGQLQRQTAVAIETLAFFFVILIVARVPDEARFTVLGCSAFADLGTARGITITTSKAFLLGWAGSWCWPIAALGHVLVAYPGSGIVDLSVRTEQSL
jgi:hypothetical protein